MEGKIDIIIQPGISSAIQYKHWGSTDCVNTISKTRYKWLCIAALEHISDLKCA